MKSHHLMNDPYFAEIMFQIESHIQRADQAAREEGDILPKDSAVKSGLRKAELGLCGKKPVNPPKDKAEEWAAGLMESLILMAKELEDNGIPKSDFIRTLAAARDSLDTRREMANSPRGYLDFLDGFIKQARNG